MLKIDILTVGKIKESYLREGILEYEKRLGRYCSLNIYQVSDEKTPDKPSEKERLAILEKEADRLKPLFADGAYVFVLAIEGKQLSSVEFSKTIDDLAAQGRGHLQFVIGGSLGLHPSVIKRADRLLGFSKMTFPHQLMRLILLEQIYRAMRISCNEPYHK